MPGCSCKRPSAVIVPYHTFSIFVNASPRLYLRHMEPLPLCSIVLAYTATSQSHKTGQSSSSTVFGKENNKITILLVKSRFFNTTEMWLTRESSSFPLCQNSTAVLHCHHSTPQTENIRFMQSQTSDLEDIVHTLMTDSSCPCFLTLNTYIDFSHQIFTSTHPHPPSSTPPTSGKVSARQFLVLPRKHFLLFP